MENIFLERSKFLLQDSVCQRTNETWFGGSLFHQNNKNKKLEQKGKTSGFRRALVVFSQHSCFVQVAWQF